MTRKTARDWLEEGLTILAESGATQLTIDTLVARLDITKGSFYHHFASYQAFKEALLDYFEAKYTLQVIAVTEQAQPPAEKITVLLERTLLGAPSRLEVAMRAWALQDAMVRAYQERIDKARIIYLHQLCSVLTGNDRQALAMARMLYTIYVGSQQIIPPLHGEGLRQLYQHCLQAFGL